MRGSSPLARGTLPAPRLRPFCGRFIPAGAGNTAKSRSSCCARTVHPRWRGEHTKSRCSGWTHNGSSPLARGTPSAYGGRCAERRFIPAGAGNTTPPGRAGCGRTVHPRWRGEHTFSRITVYMRGGSSPLARGTLPSELQQADTYRFIPAGAGNTDGCGPRFR